MVATLRVKVDPKEAVTGAAQAENALEQVERQAYKTEAATGKLGSGLRSAGGGAVAAGSAMAAAGKTSSRLGFQVQNASYQIGDFAVQVASGTSAVRAMTQQLPQLLGGFGIMGAVLGAAAAIGGALVPVLFNIGEEADSLSDHLKDVNDELADLSAKRDLLVYGAGSTGELGLTKQIESLNAELLTLTQRREKIMLSAAQGFGAAGSIFTSVQLEEMATSAIKEQTAALNERIGSITETIGKLKAQRDELRAISSAEVELQGYVSAQLQTTIAENLQKAKDAADEKAGYEAAWEWWAVDEFKRAQDAKRAELDAAQKEMTALVRAGAEERAGWEAAFMKGGADGTLGPDFTAPKPVGGGGKSAAERLADEYSRLRSSLDDVYKATADYEDAQTLLNRALAAGQITQTQYNETLAMARQRMDEALAGAGDLQGAFDTAGNAFADAFSSMVDGTKSAGDAFRDMAKVIIKELYDVLVVQRLVGSFDGAKGTGSGIVGFLGRALTGARADGGAVSRGEPYLVGERGPELFVPSNSGRVSTGTTSAPVVNMTYNFQGGVTQADLAGALPRMVEATKRAVVDNFQRGGAMARTVR